MSIRDIVLRIGNLRTSSRSGKARRPHARSTLAHSAFARCSSVYQQDIRETECEYAQSEAFQKLLSLWEVHFASKKNNDSHR